MTHDDREFSLWFQSKRAPANPVSPHRHRRKVRPGLTGTKQRVGTLLYRVGWVFVTAGVRLLPHQTPPVGTMEPFNHG